MASEDAAGGSPLAPDDAFAVIGNDTRMEILQTLAEADGPLSFSTLRERVGVRDSGQFNYHLDKLDGHFAQQRADGYALHRAGERVIEAVLSGAVTDAPVLEPTQIEESCPFCGAPIEVSFTEERVEFYCTSCAGVFGASPAQASFDVEDHGFLGRLSLPPAGLKDRSPQEIVRAAWIWGELEVMAMSAGVCPRCAATVDRTIAVCSDHNASVGRCEACGRRYAANVEVTCTNCILDVSGLITVGLAAKTELLQFLTDHGINPLTSHGWVTTNYDEEIRSVEPFEGRFTFTIDGDRLSLTVDEDLNVIEVA